MTETQTAEGPPASGLPCLNSNNSDNALASQWNLLSGSDRKVAFCLWGEIIALVEQFGIERLGFLTLTFADHVVEVQEASRRSNNLNRRVLKARYKRIVASPVAQLNVEMGDWVHSLAPRQVISHMTFAWEASIWSAQRCYEKFMKREMWGVSYFYALVQNPSRNGFHVHALWCDCKNKSRREIWQTWFERYGRCPDRAGEQPGRCGGLLRQVCGKGGFLVECETARPAPSGL